jgi:hypothetical protein
VSVEFVISPDPSCPPNPPPNATRKRHKNQPTTPLQRTFNSPYATYHRSTESPRQKLNEQSPNLRGIPNPTRCSPAFTPSRCPGDLPVASHHSPRRFLASVRTRTRTPISRQNKKARMISVRKQAPPMRLSAHAAFPSESRSPERLPHRCPANQDARKSTRSLSPVGAETPTAHGMPCSVSHLSRGRQ